MVAISCHSISLLLYHLLLLRPVLLHAIILLVVAASVLICIIYEQYRQGDTRAPWYRSNCLHEQIRQMRERSIQYSYCTFVLLYMIGGPRASRQSVVMLMMIIDARACCAARGGAVTSPASSAPGDRRPSSGPAVCTLPPAHSRCRDGNAQTLLRCGSINMAQ